MPVYVDPIGKWGKSATWKWNESCHMFADDVEELHKFARKIGLRREWFQADKRLPHYDLTVNKRKIAVKGGAIEVTWSDMGRFMRGDTPWRTDPTGKLFDDGGDDVGRKAEETPEAL